MKISTIDFIKKRFQENCKKIYEISQSNDFRSDSGYSDFIAENSLIEEILKMENEKKNLP